VDRISTTRNFTSIAAYREKKKWREPAEWTHANLRVNRLSYTPKQPDALRLSQFATDEAICPLPGVWAAFSVLRRARCSLGTRGRLRMSRSRRGPPSKLMGPLCQNLARWTVAHSELSVSPGVQKETANHLLLGADNALPRWLGGNRITCCWRFPVRPPSLQFQQSAKKGTIAL
jgi:hypothetical protein